MVLPTGSGKSAIYQVAALAGLRPAIVVSPLIALEHDQVRHLDEAGVEAAGELHSSLPEHLQKKTLDDFAAGRLTFLFITPEQLSRPELVHLLGKAGPRLFVVDEAHCVSEWGHQYRPDYLGLGAAIEALGHPRVLALTATAAPPVRADILTRLGMRDSAVIARGFDRPNIRLAVHHVSHDRERTAAVLARAQELEGEGIIYSATHNASEELARALEEAGVPAAYYHGGLSDKQRNDVHERFLDGRIRVVACTIAFGMGIDKPDVRFVLHSGLPESVDAYYQEMGRAGRDGAPANAELYYLPGDAAVSRFRSSGARFSDADLQRVAAALAAAGEGGRPGPPAVGGVPPGRVKLIADRLREAGGSVERASELQERYREMQRTRAEMIEGYAELTDCRRRYLLEYFGEELPEPCGNCDNCLAGRSRRTTAQTPFPVGTRVAHPEWGAGTVIRQESDAVVVLFEEAGYHRIDVGLALERGLLRAAPPA